MIYFLSILDGEYIKIGYTGQLIDKRRVALQTGNPHEINIMFTVDGSIKEEKKIHKSLYNLFKRLKMGKPLNEWYPGENYFIKSFINDVQKLNIKDAIKRINAVTEWGKHNDDKNLYSIRDLEKSLRMRGFSIKKAKEIISFNKDDATFLLNISFKEWKKENAYH